VVKVCEPVDLAGFLAEHDGLPEDVLDTRLRWTLAGLIEFGVVGNYKLRPNLAVHAAYDIAWLTGVALAPDQAITPGKIDAEGGFFFQGLTVGLVWTR
jgi:hypothetical protein